ncbi:MAG: HEPN domain-containing protein [Nitrospirae bacterium]|nr:HEPN domain-containing protein [Nitrospirota bacterium]
MVDDKLLKVQQWFKRANNDLKDIENNLKDTDPPTDVICFHAQQAIEKYIKGVLIHFEQHITKTHDLIFLLNSISNYVPELLKFKSELKEISRCAVEVRYPDIMFEPTLEEAKKAE